jgi:hypothetical protein
MWLGRGFDIRLDFISVHVHRRIIGGVNASSTLCPSNQHISLCVVIEIRKQQARGWKVDISEAREPASDKK